jgi:hypothetical protein
LFTYFAGGKADESLPQEAFAGFTVTLERRVIMDKAAIITDLSKRQKLIDKIHEEGEEIYLSPLAWKLLERTQEVLEKGKSL